jgi:hypothetical protein
LTTRNAFSEGRFASDSKGEILQWKGPVETGRLGYVAHPRKLITTNRTLEHI